MKNTDSSGETLNNRLHIKASLAGLTFSLLLFLAPQSTGASGWYDACPLEPELGRTIVVFGSKLRSDKVSKSRSEEKSVFLAAGKYEVTLASRDSHSGPRSDDRPDQSWYAELLDDNHANHTIITNTPAISDLAEDEEYKIQKVASDFVITSDVYNAVAVHAAAVSELANAVIAQCAAFDLVSSGSGNNPGTGTGGIGGGDGGEEDNNNNNNDDDEDEEDGEENQDNGGAGGNNNSTTTDSTNNGDNNTSTSTDNSGTGNSGNNNSSNNSNNDNDNDEGCDACGGIGGDGIPGGSSTQQSSNSGSSGPGPAGPVYVDLLIRDESIYALSSDTAVLTWQTNIPATSRVVYGPQSIGLPTLDDNLGYATSTETNSTTTTNHMVEIIGIDISTRSYYFRAVSQRDPVFQIRTVGRELVAGPWTGATTTTIATTTTGFTQTLGGNVSTSTSVYTATSSVMRKQTVRDLLVSADQCRAYITKFIKVGEKNDVVEIIKLQDFLRRLEGFKVPLDGEYGTTTIAAVRIFQEKYRQDILEPWGLKAPTGHVYLTTRKKINEIYCRGLKEFPYSEEERLEIKNYKATIEGLVRTIGESVRENPPEELGKVGLKEQGSSTSTSLSRLDTGATSTTSNGKITKILQDALDSLEKFVGIKDTQKDIKDIKDTTTPQTATSVPIIVIEKKPGATTSTTSDLSATSTGTTTSGLFANAFSFLGRMPQNFNMSPGEFYAIVGLIILAVVANIYTISGLLKRDKHSGEDNPGDFGSPTAGESASGSTASAATMQQVSASKNPPIFSSAPASSGAPHGGSRTHQQERKNYDPSMQRNPQQNKPSVQHSEPAVSSRGAGAGADASGAAISSVLQSTTVAGLNRPSGQGTIHNSIPMSPTGRSRDSVGERQTGITHREVTGSANSAILLPGERPAIGSE